MGKIKLFLESEKGKDVLVIIIIILVGLGSFELGRLSKNTQNSGIKVEQVDQSANLGANVVSSLYSSQEPINISNSALKSFFASTKGHKYYSLGCSAGKTIKQENRIYFTTASEAEASGYTLSSSCQ